MASLKMNLFLIVSVFLVGIFLCEAQVTLPAEVWSEIEVNISASEVWAVYSSPDLPRLIVELMPCFPFPKDRCSSRRRYSRDHPKHHSSTNKFGAFDMA